MEVKVVGRARERGGRVRFSRCGCSAGAEVGKEEGGGC